MPKENTHLFFADRLLERLPDPDIRLLLKTHRHAFFLGSVLPDAFYYHPRKAVIAVSHRLHGIGDSPKSILLALIDGARTRQALPDAAFAMGYLSHCMLDRIFHPVVRMLTGDYRDPDPGKKRLAQYRHRLLETALDRQINSGCRLDQVIALGPLSALVSMDILSVRTGVVRNRLQKAYRLQRQANRLFRKMWAYRFAILLKRAGKPGLDVILPLFYAHLNTDPCVFPDSVTIPAYGENPQRQGGVEDLLDTAAALTEKSFEAAFTLFTDNSASARTRLQALVPDRF